MLDILKNLNKLQFWVTGHQMVDPLLREKHKVHVGT